MFHHLTSREGLGLSLIESVQRDSRGFIWISSGDGLYRFDGHSMVVYGPQEGLDDQDIQSRVFEDNADNLWFCTNTGIYCYIRITGRFRQFSLHYANDSIVSSGYHLFDLDSNDRLLVKADGRLYWFDTKNALKQISDPHSQAPQVHFETFIDTSHARYITLLPHAINRETGLYAIYDGYAPGVTICRINDRIRPLHTLLKGGHFPATVVHHVIQQKNGTLWLAGNKGLLSIDSTLEKVRMYQNYRNTAIQQLQHLVIDKKDRIWVATNGQGLLVFNQDSLSYTHQYQHDPADDFSIASSQIQYLYLDPDENLWVGMPRVSLDHTNLKKCKFNYFPTPSPVGSSNSHFAPEYLSEGEEGSLFIASRRDGLAQIDANRKIQHFDKSHLGHVIQSMAVGSKTLLVSTFGGIMVCRSLLHKPAPVIDGPSSGAFLLKMKTGHILAGSAFTYGLWELYPQDKTWRATPINKPNVKDNYWGLLYENSLGHFYGDSGNGLKIMNKNFDSIHPTIEFKGEIKAFAENDTSVWVAGNFGLIRVNKYSLEPYLYSKKDSFPEGGIRGLLLQQYNGKSVLWATSNRGLFKYDLQTKTPHFYRTHDGIPSQDFGLWSSLASQDGHFYFGYNKGLLSFQPSQVNTTELPAWAHITAISINNLPYISDTNVTELQNLNLSADQNNISIDVVAVEYSDFINNSLSYRLDARPYSWIRSSLRWLGFRSASSDPTSKTIPLNAPYSTLRLAGLAPGAYQLHVIAVNSDGDNTTHERILNINIAPRFIDTPWFFLLMLAILGGIIFFIFRYREILAKRKQAAELDQLQRDQAAQLAHKQQLTELEMKALRAQMNPHFIYNALESISGFIVRSKTAEAVHHLDLCAKLIRKVFENSNYALIPLRKELDMLEQFARIEAMGWTNTLHYEVRMNEDRVDTSFIKIPGMLLQPFVENALKHGLQTKAGERNLILDISLDQDGTLRCNIEDNGIGRRQKPTEDTQSPRPLHAIQIAQERLQLYDMQQNTTSSVNIIDIYDAAGVPAGTRVEIRLGAPA